MEISLNNAGKRFNFNWIFRHVNLQIQTGSSWVLLGANGSGKSTLLQILAGNTSISEGEINWKINGLHEERDTVFQSVTIAAPYLELIEEFTLAEHLNFHFSIKPPIGKLSINELLALSGLKAKSDLRISYFSSGMKQRVKLLLAILSDTPLLLLDEPLSNLDRSAARWYQSLIEEYGKGRTIVVCSNSVEEEYRFCHHQFQISLS
jgi:ABC-type multidrug transport system ATPase subunit